MFCKKCGKEIPDQAVICVYCSTYVENEKSTAINSKPKISKAKKGCFGCLGLIIVLIIGLFIYAGISGFHDMKDAAKEMPKNADGVTPDYQGYYDFLAGLVKTHTMAFNAEEIKQRFHLTQDQLMFGTKDWAEMQNRAIARKGYGTEAQNRMIDLDEKDLLSKLKYKIWLVNENARHKSELRAQLKEQGKSEEEIQKILDNN